MASPKLEISGVIHAIPTPRKDKKGNSYPSIVVETDRDGKYPQMVPFDVKPEIVAKVAVGDEVNVSFNLRGREWTDPATGETKFFGSVQAWKVDVTKRADAVPPPEPNGGGWGEPPPDDIPF